MMCPECQEVLNGVENLVNDVLPTVGDLTICGHCGIILTFTSIWPLAFAVASPKDQEEFRASEGGKLAFTLHAASRALREQRNHLHPHEGHA